MQKARLRYAYRLIREDRLEDARRLLETLNDPTAPIWLAKLERGGAFPVVTDYLIGTDADDAFLDRWVRAERWIGVLSGLAVIGLGVVVLLTPNILKLHPEQLQSEASRVIMQLCPLWIAGVGLFLLWQAARPEAIRHGLLTAIPLLEGLQLVGFAVVGGLLLTLSADSATYTLSAIFLLRAVYHGWRLWQFRRYG